MTNSTKITPYLDAGFPCVFVETYDESRIERELREGDREVLFFDASSKLTSTDGQVETMQWNQVFAEVSQKFDTVLLVRDLQHVVANAMVYRALILASDDLKAKGSAIIAVAPEWKLPSELQHHAPVIQQAMPTREELGESLDAVCEAIPIDCPEGDDRALLLEAAAGLTLAEAENAFALSVAETGGLDHSIVATEKMRLIANTGFLTVEEPKSVDQLGGLGQLKAYFREEVLPACRDLALQVRGILFAGLPGGGKSLSAKVAASELKRPLVRLDLGACKGSLVGQSESNVRRATALVEAIAPCVLWIDEVEKSVAGMTGNGVSDGGTSKGMLSHLLTWLQEHQAPITTIMTCNDYQSLPAELDRAGRVDERFVIDLPTESERVAIAEVHLRRFDCDCDVDAVAGHISSVSEGWTGAEIESLVKSAARRTSRAVTVDSIDDAKSAIRPLSETRKEFVQGFREWSRKSLRIANDLEVEKSRPRRKALAAAAK